MALAGGCTSDVSEKLALARLADNCLVNSDCSSPLVCAFERCHTECEASRDCDGGARCVAAARPYKVCQLEEERRCERNVDCPSGQRCGVDDQCRDKCTTDIDCIAGQACSAGTCADVDELDENGQLTPAAGVSSGAEGSPCVYASDCSAALLCRSQACLPQCKADTDCASTEKCTDARCVPNGTAPQACSYSSECDTKRGERCLGEACRCSCVEDRDCPTGQVCNGCGCEDDPAAPSPCNYNSDCTQAGQICKSGACACQCKTDLDCSSGKTCDGCGCTGPVDPLNGIVNGTVYISSTLQLSVYRGVTEINGNLIINGTDIVDLADTFASLRSVQGQVQLEANPRLAAVRFPVLAHATSVWISTLGSLKSLELPALEVSSIWLYNLPALSGLSVPSWQEGSFDLTQAPLLAQLSFPSLSKTQHFSIDSAGLQSLSLPALENIGTSFELTTSSTSALATLSAPKLTTIGSQDAPALLSIDKSQLTSLDDFAGSLASAHLTGLSITNNAKLSRCAVDALVQRCIAGGATATPVTTGNLACTTCNAQLCADN